MSLGRPAPTFRPAVFTECLRMRSLLFATLLAVTALLHPSLVHTAAAQTPNRARVHGTILDATRMAIAGATITASAEGTAQPTSTTTSSLGEFELRLAPGRYTLAANAPGFLEFTQQISVGSGE